MTIFVIAVDGPAASGKGTLCRGLSSELGFAVLDTGKLYRAVARLVVKTCTDTSDSDACTRLAQQLDASSVTVNGLSGEVIGAIASRISAIPGVRAALLDFQRAFAASPPDGAPGAILDGRDIGTIVCPMANIKVWLSADPAERIRRRVADTLADDMAANPAVVAASITERDARETERAIAPMIPAVDAMVIDSTAMDARVVLAAVLSRYREMVSISHRP